MYSEIVVCTAEDWLCIRMKLQLQNYGKIAPSSFYRIWRSVLAVESERRSLRGLGPIYVINFYLSHLWSLEYGIRQWLLLVSIFSVIIYFCTLVVCWYRHGHEMDGIGVAGGWGRVGGFWYWLFSTRLLIIDYWYQTCCFTCAEIWVTDGV